MFDPDAMLEVLQETAVAACNHLKEYEDGTTLLEESDCFILYESRKTLETCIGAMFSVVETVKLFNELSTGDDKSKDPQTMEEATISD
jgi:hypothetical protein